MDGYWETNICKECWEEKPWDCFYKHPEMPSWYLNKCKDCKRGYAKKNRSKEQDKERYRSSPKKRLNVIYHSLMGRCYDENDPRYKTYWWRWIRVLWKNSKEFYNDMVESYMEHREQNWKTINRGTQIDRINNDYHYCKENCRWATPKQQAVNKTNSKKIYSEEQSWTLE
jgi:hypothetical protein